MPVSGVCDYSSSKTRQIAIQQVKAKFPDLATGSSGWYRAVDNRFKRLCKWH